MWTLVYITIALINAEYGQVLVPVSMFTTKDACLIALEKGRIELMAKTNVSPNALKCIQDS
jgi:hypothetical protein